jgi:DNA-directed RNA polymerase subunit RPC12/RpoP
MIILNEKEYAEECLQQRTLGENPFYTLSILARYYYQYFGCRKQKIISLLTEFISKYYPRYESNKATWNESIEKIAKNAGKFALHEIDGIWITESEMQTIQSIKNKVLERLAFTLLCIAKLNNERNCKNNNWVNQEAREIYKLARINCTVEERYKFLGMLRQLGLIEKAKRIDNLNVRITFANDDSKKILKISDFREIGYEYMLYCGTPLIRCAECGVLIRNNKYGNRKYCKVCADYVPQQTKIVVCVDCGKEFTVNSKDNQSSRCPECYSKYRHYRKLETQRIRRKREK